MTLTVSGLIACVAAAAIVLLLAGCTRTVLVTKDGGGLTDLKQDQALGGHVNFCKGRVAI